ncbi:Cytochrome P450 CYP2 subfamily [Handroanthus impetiginosus]|uniref:Cytochrome P450 CYP2 subfamily n=1 Tax=Handroanthus impetiginosus TaxID=429701 RepID=A0A2G9FYR4_9LAMI|nr:Cytochrome P450 CYP2 subfamily [Handroanthus impetiginosus]
MVNLHQLGQYTHRSLHSLSKHYSPLMLLHFGRVPVLIVSSADAAREIMKNQDLIFANRVKLSIPDGLIYGLKDVAFTSYGNYWREVRSKCVPQLLSNKRVQSYRRFIVNLSDMFISIMNYVFCRVALGRKYGEDGKFKKFLKELVELLGEYSRKRDADLDLVDILLDFQRENGSSLLADDDAIKGIILVSVWTMVELIKNPKTMKVLQDEVREVARGKEEITEDDLDKIHYLKIVIKESIRLHSHQDTKVLGYDVAVGTQVIVNAWAIGRDPLLWENPDEFHPERFLDAKIDFRGFNFELIPFGAGLRDCPGISFAMASDELVLAKLVHKFNFGLPNGEREEDLDMGEVNGITIHRKLPLPVVATEHAC